MPDTPLNPDALEAAAHAVTMAAGACGVELYGADEDIFAERAVTAYLAVAQPEVNSVEELDALPEGTILRDSYGFALHKRVANWWITNGASNLTSEVLADEIADTAHTYTVLYRPEVKP